MSESPFHNEKLRKQALDRATKRAFAGEDPEAAVAAVERQYGQLMEGRKKIDCPVRDLRQ